MPTIKIPPTLTANYIPDYGNDEYPDSGIVVIEFGGYTVVEIPINGNGSRFADSGNYYRSDDDAQYELSEFVAGYLSKVFSAALAKENS